MDATAKSRDSKSKKTKAKLHVHTPNEKSSVFTPPENVPPTKVKSKKRSADDNVKSDQRSTTSKKKKSSKKRRKKSEADDTPTVNSAFNGEAMAVVLVNDAQLPSELPTPNECSVVIPIHVVISEMTIDDLSAVYRLGESIYTAQKYPLLHRTWDEFEVINMFNSDTDYCLVAKIDGTEVVGFILGTIIEKHIQRASLIPNQSGVVDSIKYGYLAWLGTANEYQRKGIGTQLVNRFKEIMAEEGVPTLLCDTNGENVAAVNFFNKLGFGNRQDHVYLTLNLQREREKREHESTQTKHITNAERDDKPQIAIRPMEIEDLAPVFHLGERIFTSKFLNLYRAWNEFEVTDLYNTDSEYCIVAVNQEGVIAGFAMGYLIKKRRSSWRYGYLVWLGVSPDFQRMGIAQRLYTAFKDLMETDGARIMMVDTQADNAPAIALFRKMGFSRPSEHMYLSLTLPNVKQPISITLPLAQTSTATQKATTVVTTTIANTDTNAPAPSPTFESIVFDSVNRRSSVNLTSPITFTATPFNSSTAKKATGAASSVMQKRRRVPTGLMVSSDT